VHRSSLEDQLPAAAAAHESIFRIIASGGRS
jgi:hypothetical protein